MKIDFTKDLIQTESQSEKDNKLSYIHPLKKSCTKFLSRHHPVSPKQWLVALSDSIYSQYEMDFYGQGELLQELEQRIAKLLGKQSAIFCHKGMTGQLSAIKHWTQVKNNSRIAFQPDSHIDFDEQSAWRELLNLKATYIGTNNRPLLVDDVKPMPPVSVISLELPHRRAGFLLPQWQTLKYLSDLCKQSSIVLHFDGARLFEAAPYWQKFPAEVCSLCDSVYVSLYKMFGALAGGVIAADEETIEAIRPWKSRMAGDVYTLFPYAMSAMMGLDKYLPRITEMREKACHVASIITDILGDDALPYGVQSNSFVVHLPKTPDEITRLSLDIATRQKKWLFDAVYPAPNETTKVEIQIGDAIDLWSDTEIKDCFEKVV